MIDFMIATGIAASWLAFNYGVYSVLKGLVQLKKLRSNELK